MKTLLRLSKLIAPLFPIMALAVLFGTLGFLCAIGIPLAGVYALTHKIALWTLICLGVVRGVLHYAEQYCNHFLAFTLLARIRNIVFAKLRSLGEAKMDGKQKGDLISLLTSDIELLELFYAHTVSPVCIAFFVSVILVILLGTQHWSLGVLALFFYALVAIAIPLAIQKRAVRAGSKHRNQFAQMNAFLLDTLRGLQQTILFGTGNKKLSILEQKSDELSESKKSMALFEGFNAALIDFCVIVASCAMLFLSLALYKKGAIAFESVVFSVAAMFSSFGPVIAVARLGSSLSQTIAAGNRVLALLDEKPVVSENTSGEQISSDAFKKETICELCFSYPNQESEEIILSNINMEFPQGKIVGIQGKSGSGKSTILKLLMRFWDPQSGNVFVNEQNIKSVQTESLRKMQSYVTQETVLFHDTIENNIRIANFNASLQEIQEACKKANIHDFIMSLPNGYQTQVAELGDNFSGGERQRLGLARAFLHKSALLLLDEPTSNLDSYNEKIILDSVKQSAKDKTVILVSHRESTLNIADSVYHIEGGRT